MVGTITRGVGVVTRIVIHADAFRVDVQCELDNRVLAIFQNVDVSLQQEISFGDIVSVEIHDGIVVVY